MIEEQVVRIERENGMAQQKSGSLENCATKSIFVGYS
jgi:hypothetical protein